MSNAKAQNSAIQIVYATTLIFHTKQGMEHV